MLLILRDSEMQECRAMGSHGGGIRAVAPENAVFIFGGNFRGNSAAGYGGSFSVEASRFYMYGPAVVSQNSAACGGAVHTTLQSQLELFDVVFSLGSATAVEYDISYFGGSGGALFILGDSTVVATNVSFLENSATLDGGAVGMQSGLLILSHVHVRGNVAGSNAGGVSVQNSAQLIATEVCSVYC